MTDAELEQQIQKVGKDISKVLARSNVSSDVGVATLLRSIVVATFNEAKHDRVLYDELMKHSVDGLLMLAEDYWLHKHMN